MALLSPAGNYNKSMAGRGNYHLSSDYLILLLEFGVEYGVKQSELLEGSELGAEILIRPGIAVGHESFLKVVENFIERKPDIAFAVAYGKRMTLSKHGALGLAARHSRTIDEAANQVTSYMRTRADIFELCRKHDTTSRSLHIKCLVPESKAVTFLVLAYLTSIEFIIRQMLGKFRHIPTVIALPINRSSWLSAGGDSDLVDLDEAAPGAQLQFQANECKLTWPNQFLNDLLPLFDKELVTMAEEVCAIELQSISQPTSAKQVVEIACQSKGNLVTVDVVASTLNMSSATLKRKLKAEGASFRQIKDNVLFFESKKLLDETHYSIDVIAEQLGYSDASNFSKAFKAWSKVTPTEYRSK